MLSKIDPLRRAIVAVGLAAVLFVSVNIIANLWFGHLRADFTEGSAYSTSDQLKPIFAAINEPITVRLYYSEAVGRVSPRHAQYYQRIRDLLQQYSKLAGGNIKLELYSPEPFSDVEDRAVAFGLQSLPLTQGGEVGYFGLAATNSTDDVQVIPFFSIDRERFLEYDLVKAIYSLARPAQPQIGLITGLAVDGGAGLTPEEVMQFRQAGRQPPPAWAVMQQVREFFSVQSLTNDFERVPEGIDTLMIIQPDEMAPQTLLAIDQFVLNGGKALVFADPNTESLQGPQARTRESVEGINKLLTAWGVKIDPAKVVGDVDASIRVNLGVEGRPVISDYVAWMRLENRNMDSDDAVTGQLKMVNVATAGALDVVEGAGTTITPLIYTGPRSMRMDAARFVGAPDVVGLFRDFQPQDNIEIVAARISGLAKTAFPEAPEALKQAKQPIQVIVVADTDLLTDRFWVQTAEIMGQRILTPTADNGSFVSNALENLTGAPGLASLRGRGVQTRPFTLLDGIRRDAEMQYRATEQSLTGRLEDLQKKMDAMQTRQDNNGGVVLSEEDRRTIAGYRGEILATRRELRDVQGALRQNIDRLKSVITFANIGGVPIVFGLALIGVAVMRHRRRRVSLNKEG
jgi:ABC-type uncharacterized transport system involved in gliding motility auxiliary subunit